MQGDIVKAAKWFGLSLVVSTLILVLGLGRILDRNTRQLGSDLISASRAQPSLARIPDSITLRHTPAGPFQLDLAPNNKNINLAPLKIELTTPKPTPEEG